MAKTTKPKPPPIPRDNDQWKSAYCAATALILFNWRDPDSWDPDTLAGRVDARACAVADMVATRIRG